MQPVTGAMGHASFGGRLHTPMHSVLPPSCGYAGDRGIDKEPGLKIIDGNHQPLYRIRGGAGLEDPQKQGRPQHQGKGGDVPDRSSDRGLSISSSVPPCSQPLRSRPIHVDYGKTLIHGTGARTTAFILHENPLQA